MGNMVEIKVPDIGDFKDVEIIELLVAPGDRVAPEQSLITVESDKASMEIPSPMAGIVRELRVKLGDKVSQGSPILELEPASAEATAAKPAAAPAAAKSPVATKPVDALPTASAPAALAAVALAKAAEPIAAAPAPAAGVEAMAAASAAGSPPSTAFAVEMGARPDVQQLAAAASARAHASPSVRRFARELGVD